MSKKLSVLFLGFVMMLSVLVPKAAFADSFYDFVVTVGGEEYVISPEANSFEFNIDDFIAEAGLEETDKVEKFAVYTPDGVESVTFEFLTLNMLFPDATIEVKDGKAEYVVSEVLGDLDKGSDGVSIQLLRQLMYPVNNQAWVTATVDYTNGDADVLDVLFTYNDSVEIPATNAVELTGMSLLTSKGEIPFKKNASNQFFLDIAGSNGDVTVDGIKFKSTTAKKLSIFSNDSSLYKEETDLTFVNGETVFNLEKLLTIDELKDILGEELEGADYLSTYQEMKYMVASLMQDTFNGYVAAEDGTQSPFQVVLKVDGWVKEAGKWYYYDIDSQQVTGWVEDNGSWYYLDPFMKTGWVKWNGDWYYLNLNSGKMETGFERISGKTYYFNEDGVMAKGLTKVGSSLYYFDKNLKNEGALVTGWVKEGGKWYFFNKSTGAAETGWEKISGKWYYFDENSVLQIGWEFIKGKWYYFNADGQMQAGWEKVGTKWYFLDKVNGDMKTGWIKDGYKWYYMDKGGVMQTGWEKVGTKWYYLENSGVMQTGWLKDAGKWYFLDNGGVMKTGWVQVGYKWYYLYNSGVMAANTKIDGYRLGKDGAWIR